MLLLVMVAYFVFRPTVDKDADRMVQALLQRDWKAVYGFQSSAEHEQLGWDQAKFAKFCDALSQHGWPTGETSKIDEVMPNVNQLKPGQIGIDDSWNRAGTREFAVTLFAKPEATNSQQVFSIQFRRGMDHEWHPDVLATVLKVNVGARFRSASPQLNLLQALQTIGQDQLTTYPEKDQTNQDQLRSYIDGRSKVWIWMEAQPLH